MQLPIILAELCPEWAASWPRPLARSEIERLLIEGIYAQKVAHAAGEILDLGDSLVQEEARGLAGAAVKACAEISTHSRRERAAVLDAFYAAGVDASPETDKVDSETLQFHRFSVRLKPADVDRAVELAQVLGFLTWVPWKDGAWSCFRRVENELTLIKTDAATMRMRLVWGNTRQKGRMARYIRLIQPGDADLSFVNLPEALWPLYFGVRPLRILATTLRLRPRLRRPWPFLGTPISLIPGLLEVARVTRDDNLVDLGCGDGRVLVEAARQIGCRCVGIERDPVLAALARERVLAAGLERQITVIEGDAGDYPLNEATVVFLFLPMPGIPGLLEKLRGQLPGGSRIVVHEQQPLDPRISADHSRPIFSDSGMTVAHLWIV